LVPASPKLILRGWTDVTAALAPQRLQHQNQEKK
jgi:hypothetical protein